MISHLAISGDIGSGKTSAAALLSRSSGRTLVSAGDILRKMAAERGITALEANYIAERDDTVDAEINAALVKLARSEPALIYDSRIAWYLVPEAFKVHLTVDPEVAATRLFAGRNSAVEAYESIEDARRSAQERHQSERQRFFRQLGVDISQVGNYELVLDTSELAPASVAAVIQSAWAMRHATMSPAQRGPTHRPRPEETSAEV